MERLAGGDPEARKRAAVLLRGGKLVAVPTETVYGLAADAADESAVRRVFAVKGRPLLDPLIVHCASADAAESLCEFNGPARRLAERFWPGPLTLVLPRRADCAVCPLVSAGRPTLAVRVPAHPVLASLLRESGLLLAAPSANPFGYVSPTRADHVADSLGDRIDGILDGGPCEHGVESSIVATGPEETLRLLRAGPISVEALSAAAGAALNDAAGVSEQPEAPGLLPSHYRPGKGLRLFPERSRPPTAGTGEAIVTLRRPADAAGDPSSFWLSEDGDPAEIARNLFDLLRTLDSNPMIRAIHVEYPASSRGILRAVRDRLARAATEPAA